MKAFRLNALGVLTSITIPILFAGVYLYFRNKKVKKKSLLTESSTIQKRQSFSIVEEKARSASIVDSVSSELGTWTSLGLEQPLVIAMVGLPARGKSYIVKMLIRYLKWTGFESSVFNVGSYRRKIGLASADSKFFESGNVEANKLREEMAMAVQDSMYAWLHETGSRSRVAIFDATNTTKSRRFALAQRARRENVFLLFVESICDNSSVLQRNYELKLQNDDYSGMDKKVAMKDFMSRVEAYEKVYEVILHGL
jgi:hypothetical protein